MFVAGVMIGLFFLFVSQCAHAGAYEKVICDNEPDPGLCLRIQNWYIEARTNEGGGCCGLGDAYWTDDFVEVTDKGIYVRVTDPRSCKGPAPGYDEESGAPYQDVEQQAGCIRKPDLDGKILWVPKDRVDVKGQGNPTGHSVTFINTGTTSRSYILDPAGKVFPAVYCFFPNVGG